MHDPNLFIGGLIQRCEGINDRVNRSREREGKVREVLTLLVGTTEINEELLDYLDDSLLQSVEDIATSCQEGNGDFMVDDMRAVDFTKQEILKVKTSTIPTTIMLF